MSALGFGFSEAARALRPTVSDSIWNLHCIIVNPNSKLDEVRTARRRLLRLLETSKFQEMIVPPLALPAEPTDGATAATKRLDSTPLREVYNRPVSRGVARRYPSVFERREVLTDVRKSYTIARIEDPAGGRRSSPRLRQHQLTPRKASGA